MILGLAPQGRTGNLQKFWGLHYNSNVSDFMKLSSTRSPNKSLEKATLKIWVIQHNETCLNMSHHIGSSGFNMLNNILFGVYR